MGCFLSGGLLVNEALSPRSLEEQPYIYIEIEKAVALDPAPFRSHPQDPSDRIDTPDPRPANVWCFVSSATCMCNRCKLFS